MVNVSVIIPTHNRGKFLRRTIDSVLKQTYKKYEIIVVDDGSTDNTREIVQTYGKKVRYIYQKNAGPSAARNKGIKNARGKYIAFLDSDDEFLPDKLKIQMKYLEEHPKCSFLYSYYYNVDKKGRVLKLREPKKCKKKSELRFLLLTKVFTVRTSTVVVKKEVFEEVGYFNEDYPYSQDWDMWLRIVSQYKGNCIKVPLAKYRLHNDNRSSKAIKKFHPAIYRHAMKLYGWSMEDLKKLNKKYGSNNSSKSIKTIEKVLQ